MGVITSTLFVLLTLFVSNHVYTAVCRHRSKIPKITSTWIEFLTGKPKRFTIQKGYDTYSKKAKSFIIGNLYIATPVLFPEIKKLPGTILSSIAAEEENLYLAPILGHDLHDIIPFVRQNMTRLIPQQISPLRDEISRQFAKNFSSPSESGLWCHVPFFATTFLMMTSITTRFLAGPLTNDEAFSKALRNFVTKIAAQPILIKQFPKMLRPVVVRLLNAKAGVSVLREMLRPHILVCLKEMDDGQIVLQHKDSQFEESLIYQCVEYILPRYADSSKTAAEMKNKIVDVVVNRYLILYLAAIHTTSMTFNQVVFDLISRPRAQYADVIREEIRNVLQSHNGKWSPSALEELKVLDSFIHENQRLHPIASTFPQRMVMPPDGWTFSNGDHFPQGAILCLPGWWVQTDDSVYDNPKEFNGFRYVHEKRPESTPSDTFLAFGHGHHACPGRRLALTMVKLMVIEFLLNYEYKELPERPANIFIHNAIIPDVKKKIEVRPVTKISVIA